MLQFAVRFPESAPSPSGKELFHFAVEGSSILFAGSRHRELDSQVCYDLVSGFASLDADFLTGCAKGVDESFRRVFPQFRERSFVGCAFTSKLGSMEVPAKKVVPDGLPAPVALAKRTVYLCEQADLLILFPSAPIGPGSALAFTTMIQSNKPVFLAGETEPEQSADYNVYPSSLFGVAKGFWCLPQRHKTGIPPYLID